MEGYFLSVGNVKGILMGYSLLKIKVKIKWNSLGKRWVTIRLEHLNRLHEVHAFISALHDRTPFYDYFVYLLLKL